MIKLCKRVRQSKFVSSGQGWDRGVLIPSHSLNIFMGSSIPALRHLVFRNYLLGQEQLCVYSVYARVSQCTFTF